MYITIDDLGKSGRYILEGKKPVPCEDLMEWAIWYETGNTNVTFDILPDGTEISTVFLALDQHPFFIREAEIEDYKPLIFETMVFGGEFDGYVAQYYTWEEAEAGHKAAIAKILHAEINNEEQ